MGGLAAAFGLTEVPDWQNRYEITIYQLGWRLGGKAASGRNAHAQQRIEEHGLHVWMGFYENAFRMMRTCYAELNCPIGCPLATWQDAFKPLSTVSWEEDLQEGWRNTFAEYSSQPGDGQPLPPIWEGIRRVIAWMMQTLKESDLAQAQPLADGDPDSVDMPDWVRSTVREAEDTLQTTIGIPESDPTLRPEVQWLCGAHKLAQSCLADPVLHQARYHYGIMWLLDTFTNWLGTTVKERVEADNRIRRFWILWDIAVAVIKGTLIDGVLLHGLDSIDDWDLSDWLRHHGASQQSVDSALVRGIYDCFFAYKNGDLSQPALAAGAGLRLMFHVVMRYKGAIFWKMDAGMGDTVIAPLYQVLKGRGVKFNFFHQVKALHLSAARDCIETIRVGRQVNLKGAEYDPLINVNGLLCWPSEPLYDQIVEGELLKTLAIDLESAWATWNDVSEVTLQRGTGFDLVILATSLAPLKDICKELITVNTSWQNMIEQMQTIQTQAVQLWLKPSLASLGWLAGPTILTAYAHPLETWADMSQVLKWEVWPLGMKPGHTSYFCGPLPDPPIIPPYTEHDFPEKQKDGVKQNAVGWLQQYIRHLWPNADDGNGFNWELLLDPQNSTGVHRFDSQYWRANVSPAERYVQSLPGTTRYRLKANESGFNNLYLAGDWIRNGLNIGCIESAVMGGLQASQAICKC